MKTQAHVPMNTRHLPDEYTLPGHSYSLGEMREMIRKMRAANSAFYGMAVSTGCHAFIEFCGLQAKFIDLCQESMDQGVEFPMANTHSGISLAIQDHHAAYLGEKFDCIYGYTIGSSPRLAETFLRASNIKL